MSTQQMAPTIFPDFDRIPATLSREQLQAIDQKVIALVRALSCGDEKRALEIERSVMTDEPVVAFGSDGALYLRKAIEDAKACFQLLRPVDSVKT